MSDLIISENEVQNFSKYKKSRRHISVVSNEDYFSLTVNFITIDI